MKRYLSSFLFGLAVIFTLISCGGDESSPSIPVITLLGESAVTVKQGSTYEDAGASAYDDTNGTITNKIVTVNPVDTSTIGTYVVTYNVKNSELVSAVEVVRKVTVAANVPPVITIIGNTSLEVTDGTLYVDEGATANDVEDLDLTSIIVVGYTLNGIVVDGSSLASGTAQAGEVYTITYSVTDSGGAETTAVRTVTVTAAVITDA